ncbi:MAG: PTS sugar transporter subunit IIB, partial [Lachnospiraceae bacterium]|nr:PTS sugar transporter subunit IIB [Lachnospiraceae bacterium]
GVPPTYKTHIVTTEQAKDLLAKESDKNRLVIGKLPDKLKELQEEILKSEYIILGNLAKREDTIHKVGGATGIFYLSDTDIEIIDEIVKKGVRVSFQQLPSSVGTSWDTFKKTIK